VLGLLAADSTPLLSTVSTMSQKSHKDLVNFLENPGLIDVRALADSALLSFFLIEPWYLVDRGYVHFGRKPVFLPFERRVVYPSSRSEHPLVVGIADKIVRQADLYQTSIKNSLDIASDGIAFAEDALMLFDCLTNGQHSESDLKKFLSSMLSDASYGYEHAKRMSDEFRSVRVALFEVSLFLMIYPCRRF
jgi:hypothetical protein